MEVPRPHRESGVVFFLPFLRTNLRTNSCLNIGKKAGNLGHSCRGPRLFNPGIDFQCHLRIAVDHQCLRGADAYAGSKYNY